MRFTRATVVIKMNLIYAFYVTRKAQRLYRRLLGLSATMIVLLSLSGPVGAALASASNPPTLTNVSADEGDRVIDITWAAPSGTSGLAGYAFRVSVDGAAWYSPQPAEPFVAATNTAFTVNFNQIGNPLDNWTAYYIEISAVLSADTNLRNWQAPAGGPTFTPKSPPVAPTILAVTKPRGETLRLTWEAHPSDIPGSQSFRGDPAGISGFEVAFRKDALLGPMDDPLDQNFWNFSSSPQMGTCQAVVAGTATTCDIEGLEANEPYFVAVRAQNSGGLGNWGVASGANNQMPPTTVALTYSPTLSPPDAPTISGVSGGDAQATVTVSAATTGGAPSSFQVTSSPGGSQCTITGSSGNCDVTGLTNGTAHTFTATATNATGTSSASSVSTSVTPVLAPPGVPTISSVTGGDRQVSVTVAAGSGGTPAAITVTSNPGNLTCTVSGASGSCTVAGLVNGTAYTFSASATNTAGTSQSSSPSASVTPLLVAPGAPSVSAVVAGNQSATVTVAAGTGGSPATYLVTADPGGAQCTVTGATGSCVVADLDNGTSYTFTATASNSAGTSNASSPSASITPVVPVVTPPSNPNRPATQPRPVVTPGLIGGGSSQLPAQLVLSPRPVTTLNGTGAGVAPGQNSLTPNGSGQNGAGQNVASEALTKGPIVRVGGQERASETSVVGTTGLTITLGSASIGIRVTEDRGTVGQNGSGALGLSVRNGAGTVFEGAGLTPGSTVQVVLPFAGESARVLTTIEVLEDGSFSGEALFATLPGEVPLPIGVQLLQLVTVDEDGNDVLVDVAVTIGQPDPSPQLFLADGRLPTLTPGEAVGLSAGQPAPITVTALAEQRRAVIDGGDWVMAVDIANADGSVEPADSGAMLTLVREESAVVSGSGFMAGTRADVWLFSEPTLLGTVTVDENGEFTGEVQIDGSLIPPGNHTLQLQGVGSDGYVKATNLGVAVEDPLTPATGESQGLGLINFMWILGLSALILAIIIVIGARRFARDQ